MPLTGHRTFRATLREFATPSNASGLYNMIPNAVRSKIAKGTKVPLLSSLHRTQHALGTTSPERSRSSSTTSQSTDDADIVSIARAPSTPLNTPRTNCPETASENNTLVPFDPSTTDTTSASINWQVAELGYSMLQTAKHQAFCRGGDDLVVRRMHIDAISYLHMALPQDLTPAEIERLRQNMPDTLLHGNTGVTKSQPSSALRRFTAWTVTWMLSWFLFAVPVMMMLLSALLRFERQNQLTERGLAFAEGVGTGFVNITAGKQADSPAFGDVVGRTIARASICSSRVLGEIVCGIEDGWDQMMTGQRPAGATEMVQMRSR
ncbi:uncharacterized protein HMPREF1541_10656 [Cyphellophora europaea CBS 101466]|uniref:Uncharacterized protein n=1 Tax=Cyphellophora europaea (strain CBS 101466) TaxID=1220924 RepID=W2S5W5_CYPE1|nr:uncharacterized protein HMPREF1541_10656 [Cyphellophora europaea CBS 101466]ETN44106.1 hypothetical protein HMPREF1541_10656 [Cyphellophora europaea CBS 101466]